ncbi:outer membrane protein [Aliarcobacter butzleri]|uniref:outer membrane protein n=1 Tax=Aliarcobacter butzleri TaxID=28197 RepID=UPI0021B1D1CF|nr:porin family protein [Aliarcobacter butzleri]MCT7596126.1 porin family protein [Aliarcobacter butzleri]
MKKILLSAVLSASFLLAEAGVSVGASSGKALNIDINEVLLSVSYSKDFNKLYTELSFDFGTGSNSNSYNTNLKVGYLITQDLVFYGIGSAGYQTLKVDSRDINSLGFGYGAGVEYRITKSIKTQLEYKTFDMQNNSNSYKYSFSSLNLKYSF